MPPYYHAKTILLCRQMSINHREKMTLKLCEHAQDEKKLFRQVHRHTVKLEPNYQKD
jgi:hypothetical protein